MPLKYIGLGDLAVYAAFGPLLACTAVFAAGSRDWDSFVRECVFSTPVTLFVVAILHANNVRDLKTDGLAGAKTLAVRLGKTAAIYYFDGLVTLPFLIVAALAKIYNNPGMCLAVVALPQAWDLTRRIRESPVHREIPEFTAQAMVLFGIAQAFGVYAWVRCTI
jgi:1,4-dihydroxy-2-naphthoate octaprenyltransferase